MNITMIGACLAAVAAFAPANDAVNAAYVAAGMTQRVAPLPAKTEELKDLDAAIAEEALLRTSNEAILTCFRAVAAEYGSDPSKRKGIIAAMTALGPTITEGAVLWRGSKARMDAVTTRCIDVIFGTSTAAPTTRAATKLRFAAEEMVKAQIAESDKAVAAAYLTAGIPRDAASRPATTKGLREFDAAFAEAKRLTADSVEFNDFFRNACAEAASATPERRAVIHIAMAGLGPEENKFLAARAASQKRLASALAGIDK